MSTGKKNNQKLFYKIFIGDKDLSFKQYDIFPILEKYNNSSWIK